LVDLILFFLIVISFTVCPVLIAAGFEPGVLVIIGIIILVPLELCFVRVWMYYKSMGYELREDENSWKRGVWFRTNGVVP